jgi:hypothetical protein
MRKEEIKLEKKSWTCSANSYPERSHYKMLMKLGRVFPGTKAQAKYFLSEGVCLDVLNIKDVEVVETMLNKHGFVGDYKYTKSKNFVRLQNNSDLSKAIKKEFL